MIFVALLLSIAGMAAIAIWAYRNVAPGADRLARKIRAMPQAPQAISTLHLTVNGEPAECRPGTTVAGLLATMDTTGKRVAVERNGEIVPRSQHATTVLESGDRLEIVIAVGGG